MQTTEVVHRTAPRMPTWVRHLVPESVGIAIAEVAVDEERLNGACRTRSVGPAGPFTAVTATIPRAAELGARELEYAVHAAYTRIQHRLEDSGAQHLVRCWNFIPRIHDRLGECTRYMVFNAGRFAALATTHAPECWRTGNSLRFPTASGIGYEGEDLVIHCLGAQRPGEPIENPRQIPAYRYSSRFGRRPPCFTRAISLTAQTGGPPALLVAGTASVVGEDSRHAGDLVRQIEETLNNLDALVAAWVARSPARLGNGRTPSPDSLRAYYVRESDRDAVVAAILERYPNVGAIETMQAQICRPELLVEIECTIGTRDLVPIPVDQDALCP